jgi:hypothetical protein
MKRQLRSWLWRAPVDQEVADEIALHLELRTRELIYVPMAHDLADDTLLMVRPKPAAPRR